MFCLKDAAILAASSEWNLANSLRRIRDTVRNIFFNILPGRDAGVLCAVVLGDRTETDPQVKALYQDGGIAHILAVSGLHIQMIGAALYDLLRRRRLSFAVSGAAAGGILVLYCVMTGMSISAVRSVVMFLMRLGADVLGRENDIFTSLAAAALLLLVKNPYLTQDASFYMSFGSILSINLLSEPFEKIIPKRLPGRSALSVSIAVWAGMMPVMCWFYYQITPWSVLLNLIVIPCMGALFMAAAAGGFGALILKGAGTFIAAPCHYLLRMFAFLCTLSRKLPLGVVITGRPSAVRTAAYYLLLGCFAYRVMHPRKTVLPTPDAGYRYAALKKRLRRRFFGGWGIVLLSMFLLLVRLPPVFTVTFIDVGQGDCALLRAGSSCFLIDCGSSSVNGIWEQRVSDCLKYYGVDVLDGIFISHGDADHMNGVLSLLENYDRNMAGANASDVSVNCIYYSKNGALYDEAVRKLVETAEEKGIQTRGLDCFDELAFRAGALTCLYPSGEDAALGAGNTNVNSLVLLARHNEMRVFFTGDLEKEGEDRLIRNYAYWADRTVHTEGKNTLSVLKVGHQGSANATGDELLRCLKPDIAVISCGRNNMYGHPSPEVTERIRKSGALTRRTDLEGAAVIRYTANKSLRAAAIRRGL